MAAPNTPNRTTSFAAGVEGRQDEAARAADLTNQLNRAYLSGDGAAVERVMALIAANQQKAPLSTV